MNQLDLYTADQMRRLDRIAIEEHGVAGFALMQRAANAAWRCLIRRWPQVKRLVVVCGTGNNGGDGFLLAQLARAAGLDVRVFALIAPPTATISDAQCARAAYADGGGRIVEVQSDDTVLPDADLYIDALFGTGLSRPIEGLAARLIEQLNVSNRPILALDIPSGISADTGQVLGVAVQAAMTVSFIAHKRGLFTADALDYRGDLILDSLGLPESLTVDEPADARLLDPREFENALSTRQRNSHKGRFGHLLAIGGDHGMAGAIRLAGEAALRVGAGLVQVATRFEHIAALNAGRPELIVHGVAGPQELAARIASADTLMVGPGLGTGAWGHALWRTALSGGKTMVLDADGLNLLARDPQALTMPAVLTPHPGEAARLLNKSIAAIQQDRFAAAQALAQRFQAIVVLKGAGTVVASPAGELRVCPWGNPGMASAGVGDVLTGVIGGLMAQGLSPWLAAQIGVAIHAQAGDAAALKGERGLIASDLLEPLRLLANGLPTYE